ncbi:MAG: hypothetical protein EXR36_00925 [Betaproteobacteria bacterium]|nr:hypothetical protein [Betaproteobacteria bacterium]
MKKSIRGLWGLLCALWLSPAAFAVSSVEVKTNAGSIEIEPDSATSEFFINIGDNSDFYYGHDGTSAYYCAFGKVIRGLGTLKKMVEPGIISGGDFAGDQPARPLVIEHIKILKDN